MRGNSLPLTKIIRYPLHMNAINFRKKTKKLHLHTHYPLSSIRYPLSLMSVLGDIYFYTHSVPYRTNTIRYLLHMNAINFKKKTKKLHLHTLYPLSPIRYPLPLQVVVHGKFNRHGNFIYTLHFVSFIFNPYLQKPFGKNLSF